MIILYGLTFNGRHSSEFGLVMFSRNRPILPEPKLVAEDIPGMDGEYDFSAANPDGEVKYKPRMIDIDFTLKEREPRKLRVRANQIAAWLACGEQILIFDDEPDKFYLAMVANKLDLDNQILSIKKFTVHFKCRPIKYGINFEGNNVWDTFNFEEDALQETELDVNGTKALKIINMGRTVRPTINVDAPMDITFGGVTYSLIPGDNIIYGVRLAPGENQLTIAGTGHIKILFRKEIL
jgi:predicted phage tail component-like protein